MEKRKETEGRFPLLGVKSLMPSGKTVDASIPWAVIEPHRRQARSNHRQSLEMIADQGGPDPQSTAAVLRDRGLKYALSLSEQEALIIIQKAVESHFKRMKGAELHS